MPSANQYRHTQKINKHIKQSSTFMLDSITVKNVISKIKRMHISTSNVCSNSSMVIIKNPCIFFYSFKK